MNHFAIRRLATWIGEQMVAHTLAVTRQPTEDSGPVKRIATFHLAHVGSGQESEVTTIGILGGKEWRPEELAKLFYGKASAYASEIASGSGMQQFMLFALAEGEDHPCAQHPLKCAGEADEGFAGTESANEKGFMAQMMRHTEGVLQMSMNSLGRMNEQLMNAHEMMAARHLEAIQLAEAVILRAAEDDHQKKLALIAHEERSKLLGMAPAFVNMLTGQEIFPESKVDSTLIESIADEYSPEELLKLASGLKPHHQAIFADRVTKALEAKNAKKAKLDEPKTELVSKPNGHRPS